MEDATVSGGKVDAEKAPSGTSGSALSLLREVKYVQNIVVTNDHLKNQDGMVVGEEGVQRVRRVVDENRENNNQLRW